MNNVRKPECYMMMWRPNKGPESKSHWSPLTPSEIPTRGQGNWFKSMQDAKDFKEQLETERREFFLKGENRTVLREYLIVGAYREE